MISKVLYWSFPDLQNKLEQEEIVSIFMKYVSNSLSKRGWNHNINKCPQNNLRHLNRLPGRLGVKRLHLTSLLNWCLGAMHLCPNIASNPLCEPLWRAAAAWGSYRGGGRGAVTSSALHKYWLVGAPVSRHHTRGSLTRPGPSSYRPNTYSTVSCNLLDWSMTRLRADHGIRGARGGSSIASPLAPVNTVNWLVAEGAPFSGPSNHANSSPPSYQSVLSKPRGRWGLVYCIRLTSEEMLGSELQFPNQIPINLAPGRALSSRGRAPSYSRGALGLEGVRPREARSGTRV